MTQTAQAEIGAPAPNFTLPADGGRTVALGDLRGKTVVLYLYPKDDTSGCTKEAMGFSEKAADFEAAGAVVLGLSKDPVQSHDKFVAKHGLNLTLLSDETGETVRPMARGSRSRCTGGSIWELSGAPWSSTRRYIDQVLRNVKVSGHVEEVLAAVKALKTGAL